MGNTCCASERKDGDSFGNLRAAQAVSAEAKFVQANYQTKFVPSTFANIPPAEKDALLAEVFKLISENGEPARVTSNNLHIKKIFSKTNATIKTQDGKFEGEVIDGVANGNGTIQKDDGSSVQAYFANGKPRGKATIKNPKEDKTQNVYFNKEGRLEGPLVTKSKDTTTVGQVANGGLETGLFAEKKDCIVNYNNFVQGKKTGQGAEYCAKKEQVTLEEFQRGNPSGNKKVLAKSTGKA